MMTLMSHPANSVQSNAKVTMNEPGDVLAPDNEHLHGPYPGTVSARSVSSSRGKKGTTRPTLIPRAHA